MTRIGRRIGAPSYFGSGSALSWICYMGIALAWHSPCQAAKLSKFLTSEDVAGRMVLDQNGEPISLPTASDRHPKIASGSTPTYLAIPLHGGEHIPATVPTLLSGVQQGENAVGPLNFGPIFKANLDATLATSKLATVDTPSQNYLVESLPPRAHAGSVLTKAAGSTASTVNELSQLLNTSSSRLTKLTQSGMTDLEKFLHISSKTSASAPKLNLEAQELNGEVLPAAIPEPSTWTVFAVLAAGGAALQRRLRGRVRSR
jgi:hypothetical protein